MTYQSFLKNHYNQMWTNSKPSILKNEIVPDLHLNDLENDKRRGLSLVAPLNSSLFSKVLGVMKKLEEIEPEQYYYPLENIHLTLMNITDFSENFVLDKKKRECYKRIIKKVFRDSQLFEVEFKGITASKGAVIIQGFCNNAIRELREKLRQEALKEGIGLKEDYKRETAHLTIIRFRKKLRSPEEFANQIEELRNTKIGIMQIKKARLVLHDWYNRKEKRKVIEEFPLINK